MRTPKYIRLALGLIITAIATLSISNLQAQERNTIVPDITTSRAYERNVTNLLADTIRWHHNLRIGIGAPSLLQMRFLEGPDTRISDEQRAYNNTLSGKFAGYRYYETPTYYVPPITVEYSHYVNKWLSVGGKAAFSALYSRYKSVETNELLRTDGNYTVGLILNVRFDYLRRNVVQLYSSVGFGLAARFAYNYGIVSPMYDMTLFGIMVGRDFYGYFEFGGGISGLTRIGIGYRF